jgi:hypothetical protein
VRVTRGMVGPVGRVLLTVGRPGPASKDRLTGFPPAGPG